MSVTFELFFNNFYFYPKKSRDVNRQEFSSETEMPVCLSYFYSHLRSFTNQKLYIQFEPCHTFLHEKLFLYSGFNEFVIKFSAFEKKSVHGETLKKLKLEKSEKTYNSEKITINKDSLRNLVILGQVWKKVIVAVDTVSWTLMVIDQHAIHERIRYEYYDSLLKSLVLSKGETEERYLKFDPSMIKLKNTENILMKKVQLCPPQQVLVPIKDLSYLANYCIDYDVISKEKDGGLIKLNIRSVPCILGEQIQLDCLVDILQFDHDNSKQLPRKIDELLMSKACKNAIKFNDELDTATLEKLVSQVLHCEHPLYCVHGRNSMYPLCNLKKLVDGMLKIKRPRKNFSFNISSEY